MADRAREIAEGLTGPQRDLLQRLPTLPSDGRFCKGSWTRVAQALGDKGLTQHRGYGVHSGGYWALTDLGREVARVLQEGGEND